MFTITYKTKKKKIKAKCSSHDLVRTAGLRKTFSERDTTNWSNEINQIKEIVVDTYRVLR